MSEITAIRNEKMNGIEIRFPSKPSEEVRTSLKRRGFRWSRPQQMWYARHSTDKWNWAIELVGIQNGDLIEVEIPIIGWKESVAA